MRVRGSVRTGNDPSVRAISCAAAGECAAGGENDAAGAQDFVVTEANGIWGNAIDAPGTVIPDYSSGAAVNSVSCAVAGACSAGGYYARADQHDQSHVFVVSETNGSWGNAIDVPGTALFTGDGAVRSISCPTAGDCAAGGQVSHEYPEKRAFVVSEKNGTWGRATILSKFPVQCVVPNVVGMTLGAAKTKLEETHCRLGVITYAGSNRPKGRVVAQDPTPRRIRMAGFRVALTLSGG
jgi:hypothetical protein